MDLPNINGFAVHRRIGKGGMASVYLADDCNLKRPVAIKVLSRYLVDDPKFVEAFQREARIIQQLPHPNIIKLYRTGIHQAQPFMVMEYIQGGDLRSKMNSGLSLLQTLDVCEQIAQALIFAHDRGIIHRDLKPENILFSNRLEPILADFGIAKAVGQSTTNTRDGMVIGSPKYMSPEQACGEPLTAQTDLYSLGIIFYELLTGEVPFDGDSTAPILVKHLQEAIPKLPFQFVTCQPILEGLTAKKPGQRFASAKAAATAFRTLANRLREKQSKHRKSSSKQLKTALFVKRRFWTKLTSALVAPMVCVALFGFAATKPAPSEIPGEKLSLAMQSKLEQILTQVELSKLSDSQALGAQMKLKALGGALIKHKHYQEAYQILHIALRFQPDNKELQVLQQKLQQVITQRSR